MNTEPTKLPRIPLERRRLLPQCSGIYFAVGADGTLYYIGKAVNIRQRWIAHEKRGPLGRIEGISIAWLEVHRDCLTAVEEDLIEQFQPTLNWVGPVTDYLRRMGQADPATPNRNENARRRARA